jgi:pilus assembly protein CpaC
LGKGRIRLNLETEVSEIDPTVTLTIGTLEIDGFKTKRAITTVDLPSGGSMMISGLLQNNAINTIKGFPFLKDLPILGALFRSTEYQRDETELIIAVTAYLAKPIGNDEALAFPTDGFEPSSDLDLYLLGRLHREYGEGDRPFWSSSVSGPFGYLMK